MYTTSTTVSSRIESYCRTWRMWLENDESVIMGDNIMSATSDVQSTSLSDDIELGAVCSQRTRSPPFPQGREALPEFRRKFRVALSLLVKAGIKT